MLGEVVEEGLVEVLVAQRCSRSDQNFVNKIHPTAKEGGGVPEWLTLYISYTSCADTGLLFRLVLHSEVITVCGAPSTSSTWLSGISLSLLKTYVRGNVLEAPVCKHFLALVGKWSLPFVMFNFME